MDTTFNNTFLKSEKLFPASVIISALVHVIGAWTLTYVLSKNTDNTMLIEAVEALGYEQLDEPPAPKPAIKQPRFVSKDAVVDKSNKADTTAKEMQDTKGDVAGTQQASKEVAPQTAGGSATGSPYYKIKPKYPREALEAGIEGHVLFECDITEDGSVENIRVVEAKPGNVFTTEARRALAKWKYKPVMDTNGVAVRVPNQKVIIEFKLKDAEA